MLAKISTTMWSSTFNSFPRISFPRKPPIPLLPFYKTQHFSPLSLFHFHFPPHTLNLNNAHSSLKVSCSSSSDYSEEPATNVKFQTSLSLPGFSSSLSLVGTGYREKVFAIIGVKVYAAGLYVSQSILSALSAWIGQSAAQIHENAALFSSIFKAAVEKSLQIILVRDVDGKTFWDALDEAISPRIKAPTPADESALSAFRSIFQCRPLKKGTFIFLTWLGPSKMLIRVSSDGMPSSVDATIESENVTFALFDVFFGDAPVSPSLKISVANGLAKLLQ